MLTFSILNMKISDVRSIMETGLGWIKEPMQRIKYDKKIELPIQKGGIMPATGVFYYPCINEQKLIFVSNSADGWNSLLYCITRNESFEYLSFRILPGEFPLMEMQLMRNEKCVRFVRVMKDEKWSFYQIGAPLWFENIEYYARRLISNRVNLDLLLLYSKKNGVDFSSPLFFKTKMESLWVYENSPRSDP